jgi:hypothetical protein
VTEDLNHPREAMPTGRARAQIATAELRSSDGSRAG